MSGTKIDDDLWWEDQLDDNGTLESYVEMCRITLIDFGFARALSSDILMGDDEYEGKIVNRQIRGEVSRLTGHSRGRSRTRTVAEVDESKSHRRVRDLSALGTRNYAAPEILRGLRRVADNMLNLSSHAKSDTGKDNGDIKGTIRAHSISMTVSDYGMVADAFSG